MKYGGYAICHWAINFHFSPSSTYLIKQSVVGRNFLVSLSKVTPTFSVECIYQFVLENHLLMDHFLFQTLIEVKMDANFTVVLLNRNAQSPSKNVTLS